MIDYLSLTTQFPPDKSYLDYYGKKITEDSWKAQMYKYMCELEKARVLYYPHKFKDSTNSRMPFTNIVLNPKYFECYQEMEDYIFSIINSSELNLEDINVSRIDVAADIEDVNVKAVIAMLHVKGIKAFRIINDTIYAGKNPKVRIYNKLDEIRYRIKKGMKVLEGEKRLLESCKDLTRFEVAINRPKINLKQLKENPVCFASYFDRLSFIQMSCKNPCGVMQVMYKQVNRKFRKQLEALQDMDLLEKIKETYISDVVIWCAQEEPF
jgi:hypothetical protein